MQTAANLRVDEGLLLISPFEPVPLYRMLARQGFSHRATPMSSGDWEVLFMRAAIS